ncbi:MAG: hypothetical protein GY863_06845 [bacterium]|nr:hypothetical protein [bacterium]
MKWYSLPTILLISITISCSGINDPEQSTPNHLKFVYVNYGEPWGIFVMNGDSTGYKRVTDICSDYYPSWSPDGAEIVYRTDNNEGIFIANTETGNNTFLCENGEYPSWSPDGSKIAYLIYESDMTSIYIMDPDGTNNVSLITVPGRFQTYKWSPDGSKIAYMSSKVIDNSAQYHLYIISVNTESDPRIVEADFINDIAWAPGGDRLITSLKKWGFLSLVTIDTESLEINEVNPNEYDPSQTQSSYSPNGNYVAYVIMGKLAVLNLANNNVTKNIYEGDYHHCYNPEWSPDGSYILYESGNSNQNNNYNSYHPYFRVINVEVGINNVRKFNGSFPVWSPVIY